MTSVLISGAGVALVGAYVLAGELAAADADHGRGLRTTRRGFLTMCAAISRWRLTRTPETRRSRTTFATRS